jgi:hypothetical protein
VVPKLLEGARTKVPSVAEDKSKKRARGHRPRVAREPTEAVEEEHPPAQVKALL